MTIEELTNSTLVGDCLEVMKEIPSGSVDMVLCDLPYGTTQNKWDLRHPVCTAVGQLTGAFLNATAALWLDSKHNHLHQPSIISNLAWYSLRVGLD